MFSGLGPPLVVAEKVARIIADQEARTARWEARLRTKTGWVYRLYGRTGRLLYVGMTTNDPAERLNQHRANRSWWRKVRRAAIEEYSDGLTAWHAEQRTIFHEHPQFNVAPALPPSRPDDVWTGTHPVRSWVLTINPLHPVSVPIAARSMPPGFAGDLKRLADGKLGDRDGGSGAGGS
jgi:hypothetical protein